MGEYRSFFSTKAGFVMQIKLGLDLPIIGEPIQDVHTGQSIHSVAVVGFDYPGLKPTMRVQVGDTVQCGQSLFADKNNPGVEFTAPAAGKIKNIHRGAKRLFQSIVIEVDGDDAIAFDCYETTQLAELTDTQVRDNLQRSGLWTALRTRPYSKVPAVDSTPSSIFITALDTHPLAADPAIIIAEQAEAFEQGVIILTRLAKVFLCKAPNAVLPGEQTKGVTTEIFSGPHPAGLPGTHIHFLDPVSEKKTVWNIGYQDVIAIGKLFTTGQLWTERVVALAGPSVLKPRLLRTRVGANLEDLTEGELKTGEQRVISGSVFGGRTSRGPAAFLGRYHVQISCLPEGRDREFMHYMRPGANKHSVTKAFLSSSLGRKLLPFTTTTNGSPRAMVPIGNYEAVMPLDILPTQLLRALLVSDTEVAQKLGCLELDEDDLALCTYVCAGKYEYGPVLRDVLTRIEKEG